MSNKKTSPWPANEPLPSALTLAEALRVWNISGNTYQKLAPLGKFKQFLLAQPIAGRKFSGGALERWRREQPSEKFSKGVIRRPKPAGSTE